MGVRVAKSVSNLREIAIVFTFAREFGNEGTFAEHDGSGRVSLR